MHFINKLLGSAFHLKKSELLEILISQFVALTHEAKQNSESRNAIPIYFVIGNLNQN